MPGPSWQFALTGSTLEEWQAVSFPLDGQALNLTILSYANRLNLCVTACATALPHVQRVAPYCGDAPAELERAYGL